MNIIENIDESWKPILGSLYQEPLNTLREDILPNISYQPQRDDIFRVFEMPVNKIKVVILGQDPYPTPGDAIGLSFATRGDRKIPKSLKIIQTEIFESIDGFELIENFNQNTPEWKTLDHWRKQGVFLLNTALTVETGKAGSHLLYWEKFTQSVIRYISHKNPCIWLLWGVKAQKFIPYIDCCPFIIKGYNKTTIQEIPIIKNWNYILTSPHPAAEIYSGGKAGFYGCNHFLYTNEILKKSKTKLINW